MRSSPEVYEATPEAKAVLERLHALAGKDIIIDNEFSVIKDGLRDCVTPEQLATDQVALLALQAVGSNPLAQQLLFNTQNLRVNHGAEGVKEIYELPLERIDYFELCEAGSPDEGDAASYKYFVGEVDGCKGVYLKRIPRLRAVSDPSSVRLPSETDIGYYAEFFDLDADEPAQWRRDPSNIFVPKHTTREARQQPDAHRQGGILRRVGEQLLRAVVGPR